MRRLSLQQKLVEKFHSSSPTICHPEFLKTCHPELLKICHPERSLARTLRQTESKDLLLFFADSLSSRVPHPFHSLIVEWVGNHEPHASEKRAFGPTAGGRVPHPFAFFLTNGWDTTNPTRDGFRLTR
jgi:hypothetical protein